MRAPQPHLAMYNVSWDMTINIIHGTCARETPTTTHAYILTPHACAVHVLQTCQGRVVIRRLPNSPTLLTHLTPFQLQFILSACQILSSLWLVNFVWYSPLSSLKLIKYLNFCRPIISSSNSHCQSVCVRNFPLLKMIIRMFTRQLYIKYVCMHCMHACIYVRLKHAGTTLLASILFSFLFLGLKVGRIPWEL